jgi:hypothetical protein
LNSSPLSGDDAHGKGPLVRGIDYRTYSAASYMGGQGHLWNQPDDRRVEFAFSPTETAFRELDVASGKQVRAASPKSSPGPGAGDGAEP